MSDEVYRTDAREAVARLRAQRDETEGADRGRVTCHECHNVGAVEVDAAGHGTFRPCSRCRPIQHARWAGGHYMAGHQCRDCTELKGGKV